ncbi:MAG: winged helix-turn-helix domain-containing protein [Gammaproteobacteria bacterium]
MDRSRASVFYIDNWRVTPEEGMLSRGDETTRLEPKTMEVLVYLASHPHEVITRDELEQRVWHGALVGYDAVTNTIIKLRKALQDNARQPHIIATIPKKGYQLIASVDYPASEASPAGTDTGLPTGTGVISVKSRSWSRLKTRAVILAMMMMAGMILLWTVLSPEYVPPRSDNLATLPSIVILPFENLSDDHKQEYLASGITDDIITDMTRLSNIRVISGNTSSIYKGRHISSRKIAADLNVQYILKGSIRQVNGRIRINTQLYNAKTGFNVWAQRYERRVNEIFSVQDEVTQKIAKSLTIKMSPQERIRLTQRATDSLTAYDFFQEGQRLALPRTGQALRQARVAFKKAIEYDPNYGRAYGAIALTLCFDYLAGRVDAPVEVLDRALQLAEKAVALDESVPQTYWALSFTHLMRKEYDKAETAVSRAISIAPNYADGYGLLALIKMYTGHPAQALELNSKGMKLNPYYSWEYLYTQGSAYYMQGNYAAAITMLEKAQQRNETIVQLRLILAAAYIHQNRQEDAEWQIEEIYTLSPATTISDIKKSTPFADPEFKQALLNDLRQAGLKE